MSESTEKPKVLSIEVSPPVLWKFVVAASAASAALLGAGFTAGLKYQENLSNVTIAELKGNLGQTQAKLESINGKIEQFNDANTKLRDENGQLTEVLGKRNAQIEDLTAKVGSTNNCAFIHKQIKSLEDELSHVGDYEIFGKSQELEQKNLARRQSLEQIIARYVERLGTGSCK